MGRDAAEGEHGPDVEAHGLVAGGALDRLAVGLRARRSGEGHDGVDEGLLLGSGRLGLVVDDGAGISAKPLADTGAAYLQLAQSSADYICANLEGDNGLVPAVDRRFAMRFSLL